MHIEPLARSCSVLYDPLKLKRVYGCERGKLTFILGIYIHIHPGGIQKLNFSKERMKLKQNLQGSWVGDVKAVIFVIDDLKLKLMTFTTVVLTPIGGSCAIHRRHFKIISNNWREMGRILRPIHSIAQALGQDVTT